MKHWCANCNSGFWAWGDTPTFPLLCPTCRSHVDAAATAVAKHNRKRRKPAVTPKGDEPNPTKDKVSDGSGSPS